jgi:hypothetical protein
LKKLKKRFSRLVLSFDCSQAGYSSYAVVPYHLEYESGAYRQEELIAVLRDALPHFGLTHEEYLRLKNDDDIGEMYRLAMSRISKAKAFKKGDYGELLLFLMLYFNYDAQRFVTKVRLRSSSKDQIKGFDCAHFTVSDSDEVRLWLGEVKFYKSFSGAIKDVCDEIQEHIDEGYLKDEFSILCPNIEANHNVDLPEIIEEYLDNSVPLDQVKIVIPALVTYETALIKKYQSIDEFFRERFEKHFQQQFKYIEENVEITLPNNIEVFFVLLPLEDVAAIKNKLDFFEQVYR